MRERVFLVSSSDPDFSLAAFKRFKFNINELKPGTHVVKVGPDSISEFKPWMSYELRPKTVNGVHAMIQIIMHLTANRFNMTMEQLCGRYKGRDYVDARKISSFLCCETFRTPRNLGRSIERPFIDMIASNFRRHRTMIYHNDQWVMNRLDILPDYVASITALKEQIISRMPIDEQDLSHRLGEDGLQGDA